MNNNSKVASLAVTCMFLAGTVAANPFLPNPDSSALPWWNDMNALPPGLAPYEPQAYQPAPSRNSQEYDLFQPQVVVKPAAYRKPAPVSAFKNLACERLGAFELPDNCIFRTTLNRRGLEEQISYLSRHNPNRRVGTAWANISNAALLQTARELLSWEHGFTPHSFQERFSLREIGSNKNSGNSDYTGYFTPVLQVKAKPDPVFRYPIFAPPREGTRLSRRQIDMGGLRGMGLEIAWTNDPVNLFFAHIQGSAIARYPNGRERFLGYASSNGHPYRQISHYLRNQSQFKGSLSNENIRYWLHQNPQRMGEVLHQNPRYIFFTLSDKQPRTTTGSTVIPGHTVAVDDRYIPLGAVLLAEIPRVDHTGKRVGRDWRLLFAQDRGNAIKGPGRLDIYTGMGRQAELTTYKLTGLHRTYMLVRKPGFTGNSIAGL